VDPVNAEKALVTRYWRDNLNISCGGNAIDIHVFISGSLMPRRWQLHHQVRSGRLTPCLFQNLIVFKRSMRNLQTTYVPKKGTMDSIILLYLKSFLNFGTRWE
jgi:hypothetical protein